MNSYLLNGVPVVGKPLFITSPIFIPYGIVKIKQSEPERVFETKDGVLEPLNDETKVVIEVSSKGNVISSTEISPKSVTPSRLVLSPRVVASPRVVVSPRVVASPRIVVSPRASPRVSPTRIVVNPYKVNNYFFK